MHGRQGRLTHPVPPDGVGTACPSCRGPGVEGVDTVVGMTRIVGVRQWHRGAPKGAHAGPGAPWAVVLPGIDYTAERPLLHFASTAEVQDGWRVLTVEWDTSGMELPRDADAGAALAEEAWEAARSHVPHGAAPDLLVAKSMGTLATSRALADGVDVVALTPLLVPPYAHRYPRVPAGRRVLAVGGTADGLWDAGAARERAYDVVEVPGGDHSLELEGHWRESVRTVERVTGALVDFAAVIREGRPA